VDRRENVVGVVPEPGQETGPDSNTALLNAKSQCSPSLGKEQVSEKSSRRKQPSRGVRASFAETEGPEVGGGSSAERDATGSRKLGGLRNGSKVVMV